MRSDDGRRHAHELPAHPVALPAGHRPVWTDTGLGKLSRLTSNQLALQDRCEAQKGKS